MELVRTQPDASTLAPDGFNVSLDRWRTLPTGRD